MEIDWKACGQRIRDARRRKGMTQERLAKAAAISANSIRRIEHGQPTQVSTLRIIARTLRVSMDYLLDGVETYRMRRKSRKHSNSATKSIASLQTARPVSCVTSPRYFFLYFCCAMRWSGQIGGK